MKVPELLSLDASKGAVRLLLLCQTVSDDMNRELATLNLVWQASRKSQSTAIGENRRQFAVNCKWEGSMLPNASRRSAVRTIAPNVGLVMSEEAFRQILRQT
jgi:hypothetical protein